jgi:hypothetical protein
MTLEDTRSEELLRFIRGEGRYAHLGVGIQTYPLIDKNHHRLYDRCCELERHGLVGRVIDAPGHVCFQPLAKVPKSWWAVTKPTPLLSSTSGLTRRPSSSGTDVSQ